MSDDPWSDVQVPLSADTLSMRRASAEGPWDFYWARDIDKRFLLVLRAAPDSMPRARLPHLRGVEVFIQPAAPDGKAGVVVRLLDHTLRDIFRRLCLDIMASTKEAGSEADAVTRAVARTWRWHHLLRGGRGLLSPEEQIGLIGELLIIERFVLPALGAAASMESWQGPLGASQDFACGGISIESKARGRARAGEVHISSEQQLDVLPAGQLYLLVTTFETSGAGAEPGYTVTDAARRVRKLVASSDERVVGRFDVLLEAAGLDWHDDYSAWMWLDAEQSVFEVRQGFPRIIQEALPEGVSRVRYWLSLPSCAEYLVPSDVLTSALEASGDV